MKLAVNYSPQTEELLSEGKIDCDLIKCPDWPDLIGKAQKLRPVYVHFSLDAGKRDFSPDWQNIEDMRKVTETRFINTHLTATTEDYPDIPLTSQSKEHQHRILEKAMRDVQELVSRFGKENVILENDPHHAVMRESVNILRAAVEPSVITEVIHETQCGLLLDIDHARVSSDSMGISLEDYIAELPTDRLRELHMTGTRTDPQTELLQSHLEMHDEDWRIFDWALTQIQQGKWTHPYVYAFEYGGVGEKFEWRSEKSCIAEQVPILREKISALEKV
jgi:uncharacterized protein